jgi:hypothetical protein
MFFEPESEHSAATVCEGFAVAGGRVTNFTSGQGLVLMKEVLYTISGKRLPVVMNIGARALTSQGLNVHAGHDDVMSVADCGWGMLKAQLQYKGQQAGRCVQVVNERNTTRTCSDCRSLTGPAGLDMLAVRTWVCRECGVTHDRDVNAARNIRSAGRCSPSVSGNEFPHAVAEPTQTYRRWETGISALRVAA